MPLPRSFATTPHRDLDLELVHGAWPDDISGELLIAAPGPRGDLDYALFSPGHVLRLSLEPGSFGAAPDRWAWRTKRIESASAKLQDRCPDLFRSNGAALSSPFGLPNQANTAVMPWNGRILATWDVGRPCEIDPVSLDFLGEVGSRASWGPSMPFPGVLPFTFSSAHPVVDPERDVLWTVKLSPGEGGLQLHVVRYGGDGTEVETWPVEGACFMGTMHTLSQTRDWLILIDSGNFKADPGEIMGGPRTVLMDEQSPAFLVRKEDVEKTAPGSPVPMKKFFIAPPTGHFYGVYDDADGVRVIFEHMDGVDLAFYLKPDDLDVYGNPIDPSQVGVYNMGMAPSSLSEIEFDVETGKIRQTERIRSDETYNNQLSAMDWSLAGLSRPEVHHMTWSGYRPYNISQRALEAYKGKFDPKLFPDAESPCVLMSVERGACRPIGSYTWPSTDVWAGSPIFAPRAAGSVSSDELEGPQAGGRNGYVVVPVLSDDGFTVDCFDAARVADGPIARLAAPGGARVGAILHSCWLPEARPAPARERLRFADDLDPEQLAALPEELQTVVHEVAAELDAEQEERR